MNWNFKDMKFLKISIGISNNWKKLDFLKTTREIKIFKKSEKSSVFYQGKQI